MVDIVTMWNACPENGCNIFPACKAHGPITPPLTPIWVPSGARCPVCVSPCDKLVCPHHGIVENPIPVCGRDFRPGGKFYEPMG